MPPASDLPRPLLLRGDAFTSPARTPWGGTRLAKHFAKHLDRERAIGESWELSLGPELSSRVASSGELLSERIDHDREAWLGSSGDRSAGLLVKLLDADEPLSLQIHPPDEHPMLAADEGGKPESWYVIHREPGAWVAFGWREPIGRADVLGALARADGSLEKMLQRVEVEVGDTFIVDAGTPHAIGPGVTLVEPQYVARAKRGVTYRYWDWDRRYDAQGQIDPAGRPRALAVDEALAVTDWEHARGRALLERCWLRAGAPDLLGPLRGELLAGDGGRLRSEWMRVERIAGTGTMTWASLDALQALTVVEGRGWLVAESGEELVRLAAGCTVAVPARHAPMRVLGDRLHAIRASVCPLAPTRTSEPGAR